MSHVDILSPHYDDAVLSAWHQVIIPNTRVVTVFGGIPDKAVLGLWDKFSTLADSSASIEMRRVENQIALASTTATALNLDFLDSQYQPFKSRNINELADEIESLSSDDPTFLAPIGTGLYLRRHPDHITTRKIGLELLRRGHDVSFYADIPYLLPMRDLSKWPDSLHLKKIESVLGHSVTVEAYELSVTEQARKREAVSSFKSQMTMVSKLAFGALSSTDAYKWEAVVRPI